MRRPRPRIRPPGSGAVAGPAIEPRVIVATMAKRGLFNPGLPHRNIGAVRAYKKWGYGLDGQVRSAAARSPNRIAIVDDVRGEVSYAALLDRSERVARALHARGVGAADRLGLVAANHVEAVTVLVGAAMLGVDLVLVNPGLSSALIARVAAQEGLTLLVHDDDVDLSAAALPPAIARLSQSALAVEVNRTPSGPPLEPPQRRGRLVLLTSGSTGVPRGAARREPRGPSALVSFVERMPLRVGDRTLISAPIFHSWGYSNLFTCLGLRHTIVLQRRFDAAAAWRALEANRCTVLITVPTMLARMSVLSARPGRLRQLRIVAASGSALPPGFATRFMDEYGDVLYCFYGSTEASWVCIATPADLRRNPDTVGTPPLGTVVRIVGPDGRDVPPGETGRIFCGNEMTFSGYTSGEDPDVLDGLVATGDLGHVSDGLYFLDGREDTMVVSGGENVYPDEVEALLAGHPAVREVAVTGIPDTEFGTRLGAFVVVREGASLAADEVKDYVREHAARHSVPREVVFLDALPRNAMGKVPADDLRQLIAGT